MHLHKIEMADTDFSVQELKKQLFTSLKCTGILDSLKSQLRARLLDHLREQDGSLLENKGRKPSITERLLSSLFLDYLSSYGYAFTQSVFLPESRMVTWPSYTYQEILQLLHLDTTPNSNRRLNFTPDGRSCLIQQVVVALQRSSFQINTQDASIQTQDLDSCLREIDDACYKRQEAERQLAFRSLEDNFNAFRQEFETRVNGEVALQVNRVREYETNALRMEEACHYRRQLARDREELEELHKGRLERIHEREELLLERLIAKEKAIEAEAYEQRQKLLTDITSLRDREEKLHEREEQQVRREEKLAEQENYLKQRQEDICRMRESLYARADESAALKIKELEDQYRSKNEKLQSDWSLLEAKWKAFHEEKARLANELRAAKVDKELVISLHERLASEGEQQRLLLDQVENICHQQQQKWVHEENKMQKTINRLEDELKKTVEEKEGVVRDRKALQLQLRQSESELLDTVTLLKKTQHALELERLHHYSLRSQIVTYFSCISEDELQKKQERASLTSVDLKESILRSTHPPESLGRSSRVISSSNREAGKCLAEMVKQQLSPSQIIVRTKSHDQTSPSPYPETRLLDEEAKALRDSFPVDTYPDGVRVHGNRSRTNDISAERLHSASDEKGESSSTDICSTGSRNRQANSSDGQRCKTTNEYWRERAEKDCTGSTTPTDVFLKSKRSAPAQLTSFGTDNKKQSHRSKQKASSSGSWEPRHSSTNYYMMGATSLKSSNSATEIKIMGKSVKMSTSVDHDHNGRRHTEVYETKFQQNIQKMNEEADSGRSKWNQVAPEIREQTTVLLMRSQEYDRSGQLIYENEADEYTADSGDGRQRSRRRRQFVEQQQLQGINIEEVKRRPHTPSQSIREQRDGENTFQSQDLLERHQSATTSDARTEMKPLTALGGLEESRVSEPSYVPPLDDADCNINAHGPSAMVLEDLKRFSQQLGVTKSLMGSEKPPDIRLSGLREENDVRNPEALESGSDQQQKANLHDNDEVDLTTARQPLGERDFLESHKRNSSVLAYQKDAVLEQHATLHEHEEVELASMKQPLGEISLLESVSGKHKHTTVTARQKENVLEHNSSSSGHFSIKNLPLRNLAGRRFTQNTNNTEGANSEESCSNPMARAPTVKTTPEVSDIQETDPEVHATLQEGPRTARRGTQQWDVQSEQGSHNPDEETLQWVDDYATGNSDQYAEYSDAFSVPGSNNTPSNEGPSADYT